MTSLSARLTLIYAVSFLVASAGMLAVGYRQIDLKLIHGLDTLLATERQRVYNHLELGSPTTDPPALALRLRRATDNSAALFRVEIRDHADHSLFRSSNLPRPFDVAEGNWRYRTTTLPGGEKVRVGQFDHGDAIVLIATPLDNVEAAMRGYVETSAGLLLAMVLVGVTLGYGLSQVALKPLRAIAATAARVSSTNLAERIEVQRMDDEVGDLARLLNAMLDRIEASFREIRRFTADASHELKTPLSLVRLHAEALLSGEGTAEARENLVVAQIEQIDRLGAMVEDLLLLARADSNIMRLAIAPHDPALFLEELRADAEVLAEAANCRLTIEHTGDGAVPFDARWVRQIVFNLLTNALRASPAGGLVTIRSERDARRWSVTVTDAGPGVSDEERPRIFDRFFTTSESGTGLGLAICRSIVELHGGQIAAEPGPAGRGLAVGFTLPAGT